MSTLTEEQKAEVEAMAEALVDKLGHEINRKFVPGDPKIKVTKDESDKLIEAQGGYAHFFELAHDIYKSGPTGASEKLAKWDTVCKQTGLAETDMADGGYLVPEIFRAELLQQVLEASIVRPRARKIPMATNRVVLPAVVVSTHASTLFGGVAIYRPAEGGSKTASKPAFGRVALNLHKLVGLVYATDELLEDSPISLQPLLTTMFGQAIAYQEDEDFLQGDGANKAVGAFSTANPCRLSIAKETGQQATTIVYENIIKMWARCHPMCRANAIWVANPDCLPQLHQMSLAVGTGGAAVWMPAGGISGKPYDILMGRPLLYSEKMNTVGAVGDIGIADFSQYLIGDKGGVKTAASIHLKFDYDETAFRFVMRYDGQPWWLSALTPRQGSNSLSPFLVLAVRS